MAETALPVDMDQVGQSRELVIEKVPSADGTLIAYERSGSGRPVVMLGGAVTQKDMFAPLASMLSTDYAVYNYDRRGRGDSELGHPDQYSIDLEVQDLDAVVRAVGEPCMVWANCTGAIVAVLAAAAGTPITKLALYEPPYYGPKPPESYLDRIRALIAEDRYEDTVRLFWREYVQFPDELIDNFSHHPSWPTFVANAPTIIYDGIISHDNTTIPFDRLHKITIPTLVVDGGESPSWQREACETLARVLPDGRHLRLEGQTHLFDQETLAPVLAEFFSEPMESS